MSAVWTIYLMSVLGSAVGTSLALWFMQKPRAKRYLRCGSCGDCTEFMSTDPDYLVETTKLHIYTHNNCRPKEIRHGKCGV